MLLPRKKYREMNPTQLMGEYLRFAPSAHIVKGRDQKLLRTMMENQALDSVDVLWAMSEYIASSEGALDIPTFIRWVNRNVGMFDEDRLAREGILATRLASVRLPAGAATYYDLQDESIFDARMNNARKAAADVLRQFATGILGAA